MSPYIMPYGAPVPVLAPTRPTALDSKSKRWIMDTDVDDMAIKYKEVKPEWKMFYPKNSGAR